jgi:catechol 2,3-dioxygenase-like lactoylglutathione lyase family enzyme
MGKVHELGYVGISAGDLDEWRGYATDVLGHEVAHDSDDHSLFLKMDGHHHRLAVHPSDDDDVAYVGWEVGTAENMQALAAQLEKAGVPVALATPEEAADRRVVDFVHFVDPNSGVRMELHYGPEVAFMPPYHPQRPVAAAEFYEQVLGFAVSDWIIIPGVGRIGAFMHCNSRHHSLAFFANPQPRKRVHHVMMEYTSIDDVGTGYDIALQRELVTATLGRHLNDHMLSFYFKNPGDWHFELGWGAREIDPTTWQVEHYNGFQPGGGEWGHDGLLNVM